MIINTPNLGNFREGNEKADLANNQSWVRHCARKRNAEPCPSILTSGRSFWLENSQQGRRLPIDHSGSGSQVSLTCQANARSCAKAAPATKSMTTPGGPVFSTKEPRVRKMFKHHSSQVTTKGRAFDILEKLRAVSRVTYIYLNKGMKRLLQFN